ncbi:hypothetical protein [Oceaniradius stylonematis]|uniref:hypothetical protein n=1 Tax=Oceaniradius stylonematis TaxID=2184161 RepID=UPI00273F5A4E|nr:hypothetical protein [Oceaniradius stylonematis]
MADRLCHCGVCPVPGCTRALPSRHAIVCADHYFCAPADRMRAAIRMKIKAERTGRPEFAAQVSKHTQFVVDAIVANQRRHPSKRPTEHSHA